MGPDEDLTTNRRVAAGPLMARTARMGIMPCCALSCTEKLAAPQRCSAQSKAHQGVIPIRVRPCMSMPVRAFQSPCPPAPDPVHPVYSRNLTNYGYAAPSRPHHRSVSASFRHYPGPSATGAAHTQHHLPSSSSKSALSCYPAQKGFIRNGRTCGLCQDTDAASSPLPRGR